MTEDQPQLTLTLAIAPPEDSAPLAEIIHLRHHQGDADGVAWIVEQFNGWNPPDIPWDHIGVVLMVSQMPSGRHPFDEDKIHDMMRAAPDAYRKFYWSIVEMVHPEKSRWDWKITGNSRPDLTFGDSVMGVPMSHIWLLQYRKHAPLMYRAWKRDERWREAKEHAIDRARRGALMREIDAELFGMRFEDGRAMFSSKTEATNFRRRTLNPR